MIIKKIKQMKYKIIFFAGLFLNIPFFSWANFFSAVTMETGGLPTGIQATDEQYTVTVVVHPDEADRLVTPSAGQYLRDANEPFTVTAVADNPKYVFWVFVVNGEPETLGGNTLTLASLTSDTTIDVYFIHNSYASTVSVEPSSQGTFTGDGDYNNGDAVTLTAIPNCGYRFVRWTSNGTPVSTDNPLSFTVTNDTTFAAEFETVPTTGITQVCSTGQTIYFSIDCSTGTAQVVPQSNNYPYYTSSSRPTGDLVIPSSIDYEGHTYSVTAIGDNAFGFCDNLTRVTVPSGVTRIGSDAFSNCYRVTEVIVPEGVEEIGYEAFISCNKLSSFTIPQTVTSIGWAAFAACYELTSIVIPASVTSIGFGPFYSCYNLASITVDPNNAVYDSRNGCNAIVRTSDNVLISGCNNTVIPNTVTAISTNAFAGLQNLTQITIPSSVTTIGNQAFYSSGLTSIDIPNGVTMIEESAFLNCNSLASVTFSNSITTLGNYSFQGCYALTSLVIPDNITSIGVSAFGECGGLNSIVVSSGNPNYDSRNNCNAIIEKSTNTLIAGGNNTVIPPDVTSLGKKVFFGCTRTAITIPASVNFIDDYAFFACYQLGEIHMRGAVPPALGNGDVFFGVGTGIPVYVPCGTVAAYQAASGWSNFTNIQEEFPYTVTAASADDAMGTVEVTTVPSCSNNTATLTATPACGNRFVQWTSHGTPISTDNPLSLTVTQDTAITAMFEAVAITEFDAAAPSGQMLHYTVNNDGSSVMVSGHEDNISGDLTIPSSVSYCNNTYSVIKIANNTFNNCSGLTSITLPGTITSIGNYAFSGCSGLTQTYFTGTIAQWLGIDFSNFYSTPLSYSQNLFINGVELTNLVIPEGVTEIKPYAFYYCNSLTGALNIPNTVTSIGHDAFSHCTGLTSITLPNTLTTISDGAFSSCTTLTSIIIPETVTTIEPYAFRYCENLTSVVIPDAVTYIGDYAFGNCSRLNTVTIGASVNDIGSGAFYPCGALTTVYLYPTTPPTFSTQPPAFISYNPFFSTGGNRTFYVPCGTAEAYSNAFSLSPSSFSEVWNPYTIVINGDDQQMASSNVEVVCNTTVNISATPRCGYRFVQWKNSGGVTVSTDNPYTLTTTSDTTLTAQFEAVTEFDAVAPSGQTLHYIVNNDGTSVTLSGHGANISGALTIPSTVSFCSNTYTVTSIGERAFYNCTNITAVSIPATVTSLGQWVFWASGIEHAELHLTSLTHIPYGAFMECSNLKSVTLPSTLTEIGPGAFLSCYSLGYMDLGNKNVTAIDVQAFHDCRCLALHIPNNASVSGSALSHLQYVEYNGTNGGNAISTANWANGIEVYPLMIFTSNAYDSLIYVFKDIDAVNIYSTVSYIDARAFSCTSLDQITINATVPPVGGHGNMPTSIPVYVPCGSVGAYQTAVGWSQCNIQSQGNCNTVTVTANNGTYGTVSGGGEYTIGGTATLTATANCGYQFTQWSDGSTDNPYTLTLTCDTALTAQFETVTEFDAVAPSGQTLHYTVNDDGTTVTLSGHEDNISGALIIPETVSNCNTFSVTSIGFQALSGCSGLTSVTIPNSITSIGNGAFFGCSGLTSFTIPNSITSIGVAAFESCSGLTSLTIPNSVISIEQWTFMYCSGLTSVTIPNSVTSIGIQAFSGCSGLTSVTIPNSVTSIGDHAFSGCGGLTEITSLATSAPTLSPSAFNNVSNSIPVYVPCGSVANYQVATGWSSFTNIQEVAGCTNDTVIHVSVGVVGDRVFTQENQSMAVTHPDASYIQVSFRVVPEAQSIEVYDQDENLLATFLNDTDTQVYRLTPGTYTVRALFSGGRTYQRRIGLVNVIH